MNASLLKRLLLLICFSGIAVYSVKIYQLRDKISFAPTKQAGKTSDHLRLQFYMESDQAELLEQCRALFDTKRDRIVINLHPSNPKLATLSVERDFQAQTMQDILDLQKSLNEKACLRNPTSRFSFTQLPS